MRNTGDEPRADMYLPDFLLAFGFVLTLGGIGLGIVFAFTLQKLILYFAAGAVLLGVTAVMCWRNQKIRIISNEKFEYTTFLGNTYEYYFEDITALRRNNDSMTLYVGNKKVHIESMAVLSERLVEKINDVLANR